MCMNLRALDWVLELLVELAVVLVSAGFDQFHLSLSLAPPDVPHLPRRNIALCFPGAQAPSKK